MAKRAVKLRLIGLALLALCVLAVARLHALVGQGPHHHGTLAELLLALVAVLTGMLGSAMLIDGKGIARRARRPRR